MKDEGVNKSWRPLAVSRPLHSLRISRKADAVLHPKFRQNYFRCWTHWTFQFHWPEAPGRPAFPDMRSP